MNLFDAYVESLLHFNLNFYLAFSPERGRTVGELVTMISSALARSGVPCTAADVNKSLENRIAMNDGFLQASHDKIWLNFVSTSSALPTPPAQPSPALMAATASDHSVADQHVAEVAMETPLDTASFSWEQRIWNTDFADAAAAAHDVNASDFPIRLLVAAYGKLRNVANDQIKEEYLGKLVLTLNNLDPGNGLNRLRKSLVSKLLSFGETSTKKVSLESSRIIALMRPWIATV